MTEEKKIELVKVLDIISTDMKNDVIAREGKPFDGKTVGRAFGEQAAAISALAQIIKKYILES